LRARRENAQDDRAEIAQIEPLLTLINVLHAGREERHQHVDGEQEQNDAEIFGQRGRNLQPLTGIHQRHADADESGDEPRHHQRDDGGGDDLPDRLFLALSGVSRVITHLSVREPEIEKGQIESDGVRENPHGIRLGSDTANDQRREKNKEDATDRGVGVTRPDIADPAPKAGGYA
jgi:hypothetical protein